jgi:uncharacterized protein (TIGR03437 family)
MQQAPRISAATALLALCAATVAQAQGLWEKRAAFPVEALGVSAATVFSTRVYALCGMTPAGPLTSVFIYDPVVDEWTPGPSFPIRGGAQDCNVTASSGKLYLVGAIAGGAVDGSVYRYDPTEKEWRAVAGMPTPRAAAGIAVVGTRIYVAGGVDAAGAPSAALEVFETESRVWTRLPDMPTARSRLTARSIRGLIYAIGGRSDRPLNTVEEFNPATSSWRARAPLPTARFSLASGKSNSRIQVFGGEGLCGAEAAAAICAQTEEYDPAANTWRSLAPLPEARHSLKAATIDGRVFAVAGAPRSGPSFSSSLLAFHLPSAAPVIARDGILNAASLQPGVSPGALASLFGRQLSEGAQECLRTPAPTVLNAVSVRLNGKPAPLVYVHPNQINFQVPPDLPAGPAEVIVSNAGVESARFTLSTLTEYSPAIFTFGGNGSGQGVVLLAGTGLIAGGRKSPGFRMARRGETVEIYCTGLGRLDTATPPATVAVPSVTIGGAPAEVLSSGAAPGLTGVYVVRARIPAASSTGVAVPVVLRIGPAGAPPGNEVTIGVL